MTGILRHVFRLCSVNDKDTSSNTAVVSRLVLCGAQ